MDTETAIETRIKPQLINTFGEQVANSLLTWATLSYVTTDEGDRERYEAFVRSICFDERVVSVWGERVTARQEEEWKALLGPEARLVDNDRIKNKGVT